MSAPTQDWIAVAEIANGYYRAMYAGDEGMLRDLFDPRAPVVGNAMGNNLAMSLDTFIERSVASRGTHGEAESRIDGIEVIGDTAQVTVSGRYRELWFTDTLVMVRRESGSWLIDAKTFFADSASGERDFRHLFRSRSSRERLLREYGGRRRSGPTQDLRSPGTDCRDHGWRLHLGFP
ncbi:MAG: nuclear transport factor 2 family protein [Alphaproteobacteria bacterium]